MFSKAISIEVSHLQFVIMLLLYSNYSIIFFIISGYHCIIFYNISNIYIYIYNICSSAGGSLYKVQYESETVQCLRRKV